MKQTLRIITLFLLFASTFSSCRKSNSYLFWSISPDKESITAAPGQTLNWTLTIQPDPAANSQIGMVSVVADLGDEQVDIFRKSLDSYQSVDIDVSFTVPQEINDGEKIIIRFSAQDKISGNTIEKSTEILVKSIYYKEYTDLVLTWDPNDLNAYMLLYMDMYNAYGADSYNQDAQLAFFYIADSLQYIISSASAPLIAQAFKTGEYNYRDKPNSVVGTKNLDWNTISQDYILQNIVNSVENQYLANSFYYGNGVDSIEPGETIIFQNDYSKTAGALKIKSFSQEGEVAQVTFDLKYVYNARGF